MHFLELRKAFLSIQKAWCSAWPRDSDFKWSNMGSPKENPCSRTIHGKGQGMLQINYTSFYYENQPFQTKQGDKTVYQLWHLFSQDISFIHTYCLNNSPSNPSFLISKNAFSDWILVQFVGYDELNGGVLNYTSELMD